MDTTPSKRSQRVTPFLVMELLDQAKLMQARGEDVIRLEAGEPDLPAPPQVIEAAKRALDDGLTGYAPSPGTSELREAISTWYADRYRVDVEPDQIIVTSGTSPGLLLAQGSLLEPGDQALIADPGYPGYVNAARFLDAQVVRFPLLESDSYLYSAARIEEVITPKTKLVMVNSPANPTGARVPDETLKKICSLGPWVVSDEIYHELCYEPGRCHSALEYTDRAFVLNGFSKRYAMPGLRLGWVIVPRPYLRAVLNMNQNFFLGASSIAQAAGLAALREAAPQVAEMRETYRDRRDFLVQRLREVGFGVPAAPAGAFYVFANASRFCTDSIAFAKELLEHTSVSITPGLDFGPTGVRHLRLSYTASRERIAEAMDRLQAYLDARPA